MKKLLLLLLLACLATASMTARAQGTAFAYQGRLENNGAPANGAYDLTFTLYTTNVDGVAVAGPVTDSDTQVTNGLFSVTIDFGSGVFAGNNYWLDISVSPAGSNTFTDLTPRQPILPTPYAMMATAASNLLGRLPASQVSGTIPMTQLSSAILTNTETGVSLSGTFSGNGSGLSALNPASLSAGTAAINISGNAATATSATSALTATTATTATSATTAATATTAILASNLVSGASILNAFITNSTFAGNGSGLTALNPTSLSAGTAAINISGNAATATSATTAVSATTATSATTAATAATAILASNLVSGASISNAFITNSTFAGNGSGLTALNPASLGAGTAAINISGNAATATSATTAVSATTATTATSATTAVTAATATLASNLVSGASISNAFITNSTFAGNGSGLTALNPASLSAGTAGINISGNAATATSATTAVSATTAITATSATTAATAATATLASNLVSGATISNAFITNSTFAGNGSGLTALNPASLSAGTAAINITGNAATATTAGSATSATTATSASTAVTAATATLASNLVSGATILNAFVTNSIFAGNGGGLTNLNASQLHGAVPSTSLTSVPAASLTGIVPLAQLPSVVVTNTETGVTLNGAFSGTFNGSFSGSTNVSASAISTNGSTAGQVLTSSGGATVWANANPWMGGSPTLMTNSILSTNAVLVGRDRGFFLGFSTSAANQQSSTNYFTIKLSQALSTNAVVATYSPGAEGKWTNSPISITGIVVFEQTFQLLTTSNSITVQSIVPPASSSSYGMFVHVDQY